MSWCATCGTRHRGGAGCPGDLLATGIERHGRRITAVVEGRTEIYGVLVAEVGDLWRARVLTYPTMLWSIPGGRGTIKFVGATAAEAEEQAVRFIEEHCQARRYKIIENESAVESGAFEREQAPGYDAGGGATKRHPHGLDVRFGEEKAIEEAVTSDLSYGGMFIITRAPIRLGRTVHILLTLDRYTIPIKGTVAWVRTQPEKGRPRGMGIELHNPPAIYARYVQKLEQGRDSG